MILFRNQITFNFCICVKFINGDSVNGLDIVIEDVLSNLTTLFTPIFPLIQVKGWVAYIDQKNILSTLTFFCLSMELEIFERVADFEFFKEALY